MDGIEWLSFFVVRAMKSTSSVSSRLKMPSIVAIVRRVTIPRVRENPLSSKEVVWGRIQKKREERKEKKRKKTNYSECYSMRIIYLLYIING